MTDTLTDSDLRRYAMLGAEARLAELGKETASIYQAFPELRRRSAVQRAPADTPASARTAQRRRRRGMSPAQREAVRERMKRYWAQRRGAGASTAAGESTPADGGATSGRRAKGGRAKSTGGRRKMSAAARKRISDAQKARWAKRKRAGA
jgi:hypothetical protein